METRGLLFEGQVEVTSGCWEWRGTRHPRGYGIYSAHRAHRVAYLKWNGPIPEGQLVRHTCDNRGCVNPCHLTLGTPAQNSQDMKDRCRQARGDRHSQAKLRGVDVTEIRTLLAQKTPAREIATRFGVDLSTVSNIKTGKSWGWF